MSSFVDMYFGPLNKDSCIYFFVMSVIFFIFLVIALFAQFFVIIKSYKVLNFNLILNAGLVSINLFLIYYVNRIFYTMCNKSLA